MKQSSIFQRFFFPILITSEALGIHCHPRRRHQLHSECHIVRSLKKTFSMRHFLTLICSLHAFRAGSSELIYNSNFPYIINPYRDLSMPGTPPTMKVTEANTDQKTWCRPNLRGCLQISSAEIRVQVLWFLSEIGRLVGWVPKPLFLD